MRKISKLLLAISVMIIMILSSVIPQIATAATTTGAFYWWGDSNGYTDNSGNSHSWNETTPAPGSQRYDSNANSIAWDGYTEQSRVWGGSVYQSGGYYKRKVSVTYYKADPVTLTKIELSTSNITVRGFYTTGDKFTVKAVYSDGHTENVTTSTYWSTNNTSVAWVQDKSDGTAKSYGSTGTATITAYYPYGEPNQKTAQATITVVEGNAPTITGAEIKNGNKDGYDVYAYGVTDTESGVSTVKFPTWTAAGPSDGQDDLRWLEGTNQGNGTWKVHVDIKDHNNESGKYITHIYTYDNAGNSKFVKELDYTVDRTSPTVTSTTPVVGAKDILPDGKVAIKFSENISRGPNWTKIDFKDSKGIYYQISIGISDNQVTFTPNPTLAGGKDYIVFLPAGAVQDAAGNGNPSDIKITFTTKAAAGLTTPVVDKPSGTYPQPINITFTAPAPTNTVKIIYMLVGDPNAPSAFPTLITSGSIAEAEKGGYVKVWDGNPILIEKTKTLKALTVEIPANTATTTTLRVSNVATYNYVITQPSTAALSRPVPNPKPITGGFNGPVTVTFVKQSDYTANTQIYYVLRDPRLFYTEQMPTQSGIASTWTKWNGNPFTIKNSLILVAVAAEPAEVSTPEKPFAKVSDPAAYNYVISTVRTPVSLSVPVASVVSGKYDRILSVRLKNIMNYPMDSKIYYTLDGTEPKANNPAAKIWIGPITIRQTSTLLAVAVLGNQVSGEAEYEYTMVPKAPRVINSYRPKEGVFVNPVRVKFSRIEYKKGTAIYYTLDGTVPTEDSTEWNGSYITISKTTTLKAIAVYDGESSKVATYQYKFSAAQ